MTEKEIRDEFKATGELVYIGGRNPEGYSDKYVHWLESKIQKLTKNDNSTVIENVDDIMDIFSEYGTKVKYTGKNGYDSDKEHADNYLNVDEIYTVDYTNVGDWRTTVRLIEFPALLFNAVHFNKVK